MMTKISALIVCMTVCGAALFAQTPVSGFETKAAGAPNGGGVVITKYKGKGGYVVIPATIGGKSIVGIGESAFSWKSDLNSVTIPAGVTSIGSETFSGCDKLKPEIRADIERRFGTSVFSP